MMGAILNRIRDFFLTSSGFNGVLLSSLGLELKVTWSEMQRFVSDLVRQDKVSLAFASYSTNPHIKRLPDLPIDEQVRRFAIDDPHTICAYPSPQVIRDDPSEFVDGNRSLKAN